MKIWVALILSTLLVTRFGFAADKSESSLWERGLDHAQRTLHAGTDATGWGILTGGLIATVVAHQYDQETRDAYRSNQKLSRDVSRFGAFWGSGGPGLALAMTQLQFDSRQGLAHAESIILTSATHISIAALVRRGRPSKPNSWTSFPSGHSSSAWATASSLSYSYGWPAAIPAYSAAVLTMGARLSDDKHWLSDTVAAATIGLFWGRATHFHEQEGKRISWMPFVAHNGIGAGMNYEF